MPRIAFITGSGNYLTPTENLIQPDDFLAAQCLIAQCLIAQCLIAQCLNDQCLSDQGIEVVGVRWNDPSIDWSEFALLILRSCYDYHQDINAFFHWLTLIESSGLRLHNEPSLLRWNSHKSYLLELNTRGIATIPTVVIPQGSSLSIAELLKERSWTDCVLKPAISNAGENVVRGNTSDLAQIEALYRRLGPTKDMLLQELASGITTEGEWAAVFIAGTFSHSFLKRPAEGEFRVNKHLGGAYQGLDAPAEVLELAKSVIATLPSAPLYARVDTVRQDARVLLCELELIEPGLSFGIYPPSAQSFAQAVLELL